MLRKRHIREDVGHIYAHFSALLITLRNLKTTTRKTKVKLYTYSQAKRKYGQISYLTSTSASKDGRSELCPEFV